MVMLTQLDGTPVWVESTRVEIIRLRSHECGPGTGAVIRMSNTSLCVKESPDQIRERLKESRQ